MKPVKIAQIGTAHDHAAPIFNCLVRNPDYFELVGVAEISSERDNRPYAKVNHCSIDQLLAMDDLEAVTIEVEEEHATEYAQIFADKGVAVHLDKPGSPNIASFEKIVDTLREKNTVFSMGYMYRYNPAIMDVFERVRRGELGDIYSVEAQMSVHHQPKKHEWLKKYPGGMMYFLGCHLVDLVYRILGDPEEVICLNAATGQYDVACTDFGFAVLRYKNGSSFVKSCAAEYNGFERRQLVVCGTKGSAEIKPLESYSNGGWCTPYRVTDLTCEKDVWRDNSTYFNTGTYNRYDTMMRSFAEYIRGEKENPYTYEYEKKLFRLIAQCCGITE